MQETAQQYTQRLLGYLNGQGPLKVQKETAKKLAKLVKGLSKKQVTTRPEPGKWSVAEILAHLADAEVVIGWRMRSIAAHDGVSIQGFDQDEWAAALGYARCDPKVSLENFRAVREANLSMLKALPKALWDNHGMHSERGKETITHVVRLIAGHDLNHLMQVEAIRKSGKAKRAA